MDMLEIEPRIIRHEDTARLFFVTEGGDAAVARPMISEDFIVDCSVVNHHGLDAAAAQDNIWSIWHRIADGRV